MGGVGKTFLLDTLLGHRENNEWGRVSAPLNSYVPTASACHSTETEIEDCSFDLEIWDTAGQEALGSLRKCSYAESDIFLLAYDMCDADSLAAVSQEWLSEVKEYWKEEQLAEGLSYGLILVGCK